jgi:4'-phosphopantetheinyl transferase
MPLIKNKNPNIYIWKNIETKQELLAMLKEKDVHEQNISLFKSDDRIRQYLTNRLLVQLAVGDYAIVKGSNNKPYLADSEVELSFTHNKEYTVLMTSDIPCGIDVQSPTEKAVRVKSKFINDNDFCALDNDLETLSKAWSCKEAAFKKHGTNEIYLKENITIVEQLPDNIYNVIVKYLDQEHQVLLKQESIENNYLFFTIN